MKSFDKNLSILLMSLLSISGLGIYLLKTFGKVQTAYGPRQSPYLEYFNDFHILVVPFVLFFLGFIWKDHVRRHFKKLQSLKSYSGLTLILVIVFSALSGFLLFVWDEPFFSLGEWHFWSGVVVSILYGAHFFLPHKKPSARANSGRK